MSKPGGKSGEDAQGRAIAKSPSGPVKVPISTVVKSSGLNPKTAKPTAQYTRMVGGPNRSPDAEAQQKIVQDLLRHGGHGSIGAIQLRTKNFGLPRDKLLDIAHVFKPLWQHGIISTVVPMGKGGSGSGGGGREPDWNNSNLVIMTVLTETEVKKARKLPSTIIDTIADSGSRRKRS